MIKKVIGIDIGGTNLRLGVVSADNKIEFFEKIAVSKVCTGADSAENLAVFIANYIQRNGITGIQAIAVGCPSSMNKSRTRLINTPNVVGLDDVALGKVIESKTGIKTYLEKDVAMLFFNDLMQLNLQNEGIIIGIYVGTGIGNVISINGELLSGADGVACEIGHIPVSGNSRICGCGNEGCIETIAAGKMLESIAGDKLIADVFSEDTLQIRTFVDSIAIAVATEVNILNPNFIILGGGVIAMKNFPKKLLQERIYFHSRKPLPAESLKIYYSKDCPEGGVLGAAKFAFSKLDA